MAEQTARAQAVRKAKQTQKIQAVTQAFQRLFLSPKKRALRKEVWIDTPFGKARTLWYGFENRQTAPLFFDLHGGGFILGSADMDETINLQFQKQVGCKVISIEYAKAPDFPYPAAVNQVYAVIQHVFENAERYAVDRQKMAVGGHSAGANLSTVTCMKAKKSGQFQFACQLLDYPPLDLATSPLDKPQPPGCIPPHVAQMFDACYIDPVQARDPYVSPVYASAEDLTGLPPAMLILAGRDSLHDEGIKYRGMLEAAGVSTECYEYPDAAHGFTMQPSADTTDACAKMVDFLRKYLLG